MKASLRSANIRLDGLRLENGLVVDTIVITASGCSFDPTSKQFRAPQGASLEATIGPGSVSAFIEENPPENVSDLQVLLGSGQVVVSAKVQAFISINIQATGELVPVDATKIEFRPSDVRVAGGLGVPSGLVDNVLSKVNPLIDLSDLPFPLKVDRIEVHPEGIKVFAGLDAFP